MYIYSLLVCLPQRRYNQQFAKLTPLSLESVRPESPNISAFAYLRFGVILWIAARLQRPSAAGSKTRPLQATLLLLDDWIPSSPSYWLLVRMTRPTTNGVKMFTSGPKWIEKNTPEPVSGRKRCAEILHLLFINQST